MLIAVPAILLETGLIDVLNNLSLPTILSLFLRVFIAISFKEEFLKYWVVKKKVLDNPEFEEPVDVILYMIIAAWGCAAA